MRSIQEQVLDDLVESGVPEEVQTLVLGALAGDEDFDGAVAGTRPAVATAEPIEEAAGVYLKSIEVEGFRGVGPKANIQIKPGPGLTLVIGRNGSGKSSFAEAAEIAITGRSSRWSDKGVVWKSAWRNLHHDTAGIRVQFMAERTPQPGTVTCRWPGDDVESPDVIVKRQGHSDTTLESLGWGAALQTFRPFLSYAELGDAITGQPTKLHDALYSILGLQEAEDALGRLQGRKKEFDTKAKASQESARGLRPKMSELDDARAISAALLLGRRAPDLDELEKIALGSAESEDPRLQAWRQIVGSSFPTPEEVQSVAAGLEAAANALKEAEATIEPAAARLAELLDLAATHIDEHGAGPCPVCGQTELDAAWSLRARTAAAEYRGTAQSVHGYREGLAAAKAAAGGLRAMAPPAQLFLGHFPEAADALERWHSIPIEGAPSEIATGLLDLCESTQARLEEARQSAAEQLREQGDRWRPLARELAAWLADARSVSSSAEVRKHVQAAESWMKTELDSLKSERMTPFAAESSRVWQQLRQESNVDLGGVHLVGAKNRRAVQLDVTVDGTQATSALGVMSQGELHALGLALFIPRATSSQSPFRFLVIDDPVQAMDPSKVDGLAQVLHDVAQTRQVVVFTHDDRLPESIRRLQIPAVVWEVVRRPGSVVDIRKSSDPVARYLADAWALGAAEELAPEIRGPVVSGFLRSAIEAVAQDKIRRVRITRGEGRVEVEALITEADTTNKLVSLALFEDKGKGADVLGRLNSWGKTFADAYRLCREGVHGAEFEGWDTADFRREVNRIRDLTDRLNSA